MGAAEIAPRAVRLADLPASPVLALLDLVPTGPEPLAALQIRPAAADGRVLLEVAGPSLMGRIEADGDCYRPVAIPRGPLAVLRKRHPDAERLVLDQLEAGVGLRSFGPDATVAMTVAAAAALPELPLVDLPEHPLPASGDALPLLLDPQLLARTLAVLRRLGCDRVRLELLSHPLVGAAVAIHPSPGCELAGAVQLARCVLPEAR
jgi:hypothetical protein